MYPKETVVAEFAGRDSIAAILKVFERNDINYILPIASTSPTEHGETENIIKNYNDLKKKIEIKYKNKKQFLELQYYSPYDLWKKINCSDIQGFINRFNFYSPCIGCHFYFHLSKVKFANKYSKRIISGERISHDGQIKINQSKLAIDTYKEILKEIGIELITPLENISNGNNIKDIIGSDWEQGQNHLECVYSGNYKDKNSNVTIKEKDIANALKNYYKPLAIKLYEEGFLNE